MNELEKYRVNIAAEVELGADDNLIEGTEVTVEAFSPALALVTALTDARAQLVELMGDAFTKEELMAQMALDLTGALGELGKAMGIDPSVFGQKDEPVRDASAPLPVMPICGCGHRYDHHEHNPENPTCQVGDCPCSGYKAKEES